MAEVMKAVVFDTFGPPDVLTLKDVPVPSAEPGRVLIKLEAAGKPWRLLFAVVWLPAFLHNAAVLAQVLTQSMRSCAGAGCSSLSFRCPRYLGETFRGPFCRTQRG
jgi:hypothetical protein